MRFFKRSPEVQGGHGVGRLKSGSVTCSVNLSESSSFVSLNGYVTVQGNVVGANASTVRAFGNLEVHASAMKVAEGVDYVGSVFKSLYGSVALRFSGTSDKFGK